MTTTTATIKIRIFQINMQAKIIFIKISRLTHFPSHENETKQSSIRNLPERRAAFKALANKKAPKCSNNNSKSSNNKSNNSKMKRNYNLKFIQKKCELRLTMNRFKGCQTGALGRRRDTKIQKYL